jgi:hypothetical protein
VRVVSSEQEFLQYAEQCAEMAVTGIVDGHRDALKEMSRAWRKLAEEEERIADLVRAVDQLFPPQPNTIRTVEPQKRRGLIPRLAESLLARQLLRTTIKPAPSPGTPRPPGRPVPATSRRA